MLILGLGLGLRDLALAKKLRPKVLWDYKCHLGFNCRRILFSELYFKIRVPYILPYLQWTRVVVLDGTVPASSSEILFLVLWSLLHKRHKSTKKQNFTTSSFIASLCIMGWPWECGLGLEWSGLVNITAVNPPAGPRLWNNLTAEFPQRNAGFEQSKRLRKTSLFDCDGVRRTATFPMTASALSALTPLLTCSVNCWQVLVAWRHSISRSKRSYVTSYQLSIFRTLQRLHAVYRVAQEKVLSIRRNRIKSRFFHRYTLQSICN